MSIHKSKQSFTSSSPALLLSQLHKNTKHQGRGWVLHVRCWVVVKEKRSSGEDAFQQVFIIVILQNKFE